MNQNVKYSSSQIRYMIWLARLSREGVGVKNIELATVLGYSKPSVHNMLRSLADAGIVTQEAFGLAHLTEEGRRTAEQYLVCFELLEQAVTKACGEASTTEIALCGILADMPPERLSSLYRAQISDIP